MGQPIEPSHQSPADRQEQVGAYNEECLDSPDRKHAWREKSDRTFDASQVTGKWLQCPHCQAWRDIDATAYPQRQVDFY